MQESNEIKELLMGIRDLQQEQLNEYRKVTERSLKLQQQAVTRQEQMGRLYRVVLVLAGIIIVCIIVLLVYLFNRLL